MKLCSICGEEIECVLDEDYGFCNGCEEKVVFMDTTELETKEIDDYDLGIPLFELLDLITQRDYIMDSIGSAEEKLLKINQYIDNGYFVYKEIMEEVENNE